MKKRAAFSFILAAAAVICALTVMPGNVRAASKLEKQCAKILKAAKVSSKDDDLTKLEKLFDYVTYKKVSKGEIKAENFTYARDMTFTKDSAKKNWTNKYAYNMFLTKSGSCYRFAAGYGFLALKATGLPVRVYVGKTKGFGNPNQQHAWTEIKIKKKWYVFDTNMDKLSPKVKKPHTYFNKPASKVKKVYYNFKGAKYYDLSF